MVNSSLTWNPTVPSMEVFILGRERLERCWFGNCGMLGEFNEGYVLYTYLTNINNLTLILN